MQPFEFHQLAEDLLRHHKNAAGFRSAISRAYYGAFLTAVEFLARMNIHPISQNQHVEVVTILGDTGDADIDEAGTMLGNLRDARNTADYKLNEKHVEQEAQTRQYVDEAGLVIGRFSTCRTDATRFAAVGAHAKRWVGKLRGTP